MVATEQDFRDVPMGHAAERHLDPTQTSASGSSAYTWITAAGEVASNDVCSLAIVLNSVAETATQR